MALAERKPVGQKVVEAIKYFLDPPYPTSNGKPLKFYHGEVPGVNLEELEKACRVVIQGIK